MSNPPDLGPAVVTILERLETSLPAALQTRRALLRRDLVTCHACGCLCRPPEHCPKCQPEQWEGSPT